MRTGIVLSLMIALLTVGMYVYSGNNTGTNNVEAQTMSEPDKLMVVWTSGDRDVAIKMVFMYAYNAKKNGWWDEVTLVVWGPSSKLLSTDTELQEYIAKMKDEGVILEACKACADMYGVSDKLGAMGIDVKYMGQPLTDALKAPGWKVVTF